jgi:hypothetical protein
MTAFGMGYSALQEVEVGAEGVATEPQLTLPQQSQSGGAAEWRDRLLTFIPGDVVGGYTVVAAGIPHSTKIAWAVAIIFTVIAPLVVFWGLGAKAKEVGAPIPRKQLPWFRIVAAPISFAAWVFALPGSPADSLAADIGWLKSVVLVVVAIVISALAKRYDRGPAIA